MDENVEKLFPNSNEVVNYDHEINPISDIIGTLPEELRRKTLEELSTLKKDSSPSSPINQVAEATTSAFKEYGEGKVEMFKDISLKEAKEDARKYYDDLRSGKTREGVVDISHDTENQLLNLMDVFYSTSVALRSRGIPPTRETVLTMINTLQQMHPTDWDKFPDGRKLVRECNLRSIRPEIARQWKPIKVGWVSSKHFIDNVDFIKSTQHNMTHPTQGEGMTVEEYRTQKPAAPPKN